MLLIYNEDCVEYIRSNVNIKEQRKRLFSKYALNLAFLNIQTSKESFDHYRTFVNAESLCDRSYSFSFQFFLNENILKFNNKKL